jgi:predicted CopG family antitoxin
MHQFRVTQKEMQAMIDKSTSKMISRRVAWKKRELFDLLSEWIPHIELEDEVSFKHSTFVLNECSIFYLGDLVA